MPLKYIFPPFCPTLWRFCIAMTTSGHWLWYFDKNSDSRCLYAKDRIQHILKMNSNFPLHNYQSCSKCDHANFTNFFPFCSFPPAQWYFIAITPSCHSDSISLHLLTHWNGILMTSENPQILEMYSYIFCSMLIKVGAKLTSCSFFPSIFFLFCFPCAQNNKEK